MDKNRLTVVGIIAAFLISQAACADDDFVNSTPTGSSVNVQPDAQYNSFFGRRPIRAHIQFGINGYPQSSTIGVGQSYPDYGHGSAANQRNQSTPATCGDRFDGICQKSRYRTLDGSCNNPHNPTWGQANTRYSRLLNSNYADGVHAPTQSISGNSLPLSRSVSLVLFPDVKVEDKQWTLATMQWGQKVTHDMAMADGTTQSRSHPTRCCTDNGQFLTEALNSPLCYPIIVPNDDPVHSAAGTKCMNFVRTTTDLDRGCSSSYEPAEQLTAVSHFLDLSLIYGSDAQTLAGLRAGYGGRLIVDVRNGKEWPPAAVNKSASCDTQSEDEVCYRTGDARANQNPQLTILRIILWREHNNIADILAHINPHWNDEILFQEARRINVAQYQHITYYEWLPILLGVENSFRYKPIYDTKGYATDYSPAINPSTLNEHSTAAFRHFHSSIAGRLQLVNEQRHTPGCPGLRLSDYLERPAVIEKDDNMDDLIRGLTTQPEEESDEFLDSEITQYFFRGRMQFGTDLKAIDIQRSRDHGLASYNNHRQYCGLPKARQWSDFTDHISPENVDKLAQLYETPDDVDLAVGGSLERNVDGALAGPTFLCILSEQFYRSRAGDRFWFETSDYDIAFTPDQLAEIRKSSLSRLLCDNGNDIKSMQPRGFELISEKNPLVECEDLPEVDLTFWKAADPQYHQK